jgi:hypothetical protein
MQLMHSLGVCEDRATIISKEKVQAQSVVKELAHRPIAFVVDNLNVKLDTPQGGTRMMNVGAVFAIPLTLPPDQLGNLNTPKGELHFSSISYLLLLTALQARFCDVHPRQFVATPEDTKDHLQHVRADLANLLIELAYFVSSDKEGLQKFKGHDRASPAITKIIHLPITREDLGTTNGTPACSTIDCADSSS